MCLPIGRRKSLYKAKYTAGDFTPVSRFTFAPLILGVDKDLGVRSVQELVAYGKADPGKLNCSHTGIGGTPQVAARRSTAPGCPASTSASVRPLRAGEAAAGGRRVVAAGVKLD